MDESVKMVPDGRMAELMVNIAPQIYRQHVIYDKERPVLYITLKKSLYGCPMSVFMFYENLVEDMRSKPLAHMLVGARVHMLSEAGAQKHRHSEV